TASELEPVSAGCLPRGERQGEDEQNRVGVLPSLVGKHVVQWVAHLHSCVVGLIVVVQVSFRAQPCAGASGSSRAPCRRAGHGASGPLRRRRRTARRTPGTPG